MEVWKRSHTFVLALYKATDALPASEQFGLTSQMRRAGVSITSNIAEGFDRSSTREFKQFLIVSRASLSEVQSQLLIARDLGFLRKEVFDALANESQQIHKMINGLIKHLLTRQLTNS